MSRVQIYTRIEAVIDIGAKKAGVKAIAETLAFRAKDAGEPALGSEGVNEGEWALVDLNGVVVHVMLPRVRDFYNLERLWSAPGPASHSVSAGTH